MPKPIGECFVNDLTREELDAALIDHKRIATYPREGAGIDAYVGVLINWLGAVQMSSVVNADARPARHWVFWLNICKLRCRWWSQNRVCLRSKTHLQKLCIWQQE